MTALADACHDLARALPRAQALTATPDTDGHTRRTAPASRPPWNQAAAAALLDAAEGARQLEAAWRSHAAGRPVPVRPMAMTGTVLASLLRLAEMLPPCPPPERGENGKPRPCRCERCEAVRSLIQWTTPIYQLAAVDTEEHAVKLMDAVCPYCEKLVLLARIRERRVACPRGAADCTDSDGNPPKGQMGYSRLDGTPQIEWNDGLVT